MSFRSEKINERTIYMFLSIEDIVDLTDRKRAPEQIIWLQEHGYRFDVGASGRPKVLLAEVENHLLSAGKTKAKMPRLHLLNKAG